MKKQKFLMTFLLLAVIFFTLASNASGMTLTANPPSGKVGKFYSTLFHAYSAYGIKRWSHSGSIPGLTFSTQLVTATLSGTPTTAGTYSLSVTVYDNNGSQRSASYRIKIDPSDSDPSDPSDPEPNPEEPLRIAGSFSDNDSVGTEYPKSVYGEIYGRPEAQNGTPPYTWEIISGDLPNGLSIACSDMGLLPANTYIGKYANVRGITTLGGEYKFRLKVTDSKGGTAEKDFTFRVKEGNIDVLSLGEHDYADPRGTWYGGFDIYERWGGKASGGRAPYTWEVTAGKLPTGLALACSDSSYSCTRNSNKGRYGFLYGIPKGNGIFKFILKITDADGRSISKEYKMTCKGGDKDDPDATGDITLTENPLPVINGEFSEGAVDKSFSSYVTASSGKAPYTWSVSYGEIPEGMTLTCSDSATEGGSGKTGKYAHLSGTVKEHGFYNFTIKVTDANDCTTARAFTVKVKQDKNSLTISGDNFPNGIIGDEYLEYIAAEGGTPPYKWYIDGKTPEGTAAYYSNNGFLGDSTGKYGIVYGTPTKIGAFNFNLTVKDSTGRSAGKDFTITILEDPKISITTASLANGVVGAKYSKTISATVSGMAGSLKWTSSGTLPTGLKLKANGNKFTLSGTPTKTGTFKFTVNAAYNNVKASKTYTVKITKTTLSGTVSDGVIKASYKKTFTASGGTKSYTWSKSGTLPNGLKLKGSNASATLSGTPTKAGRFTFTIKVTDANNKSASKSYTVNITKPEITGALSDGIVKAKYSCTLKVSGGTKNYAWSTSGTLPTGLTFKGSNTKATISGTPKKAGSYKFKVTAKDANGASVSKSFTVNVTKTTLSGTLNNGIVKAKYSCTLKVSGGTKNYTWSTSGTLPTGLTFKGSNTKATISGTPKKAGSYKFKVTVEDANGAAASKNFTIKISAANSKASKDNGSNEIEEDENIFEDENISTYEIFDELVENENTENNFSNSFFRTSLEVLSDDILSKGTGKDEDIVDVKANLPVAFKLGEWVYANGMKAEISDALVYIDDKPVEEILISDEGFFTVPAEFVKDDFKIYVKAQNGEIESEELFISSIE